MEANPRQRGACDEADELVGEAVRLQRPTVSLGDDVHIIRLPHAKPQQFFGLSRLVPAQLLNGQRGQRHRAGTTTLRSLLASARLGLFGAADYAKLCLRLTTQRYASATRKSHRAGGHR